MWFSGEKISTSAYTFWIGIDRARPSVRRVFSVMNEQGGLRSWQGEMSASAFAHGLPVPHLLGLTRRQGMAAARPFTPGQEWDPAAKPFVLLCADLLARQMWGETITQVGWEAQRIVQTGELSLARIEADWQGGMHSPAKWTPALQEWLIRGLGWAQETALARFFENRLRPAEEHRALPVVGGLGQARPVAGSTMPARGAAETEAEATAAA